MMCIGLTSYGFILFGVCSASCIYRLLSFAKFGKLSAIIPLGGFSGLLSFLFLWDFKDTDVRSLVIADYILHVVQTW